MNLLKSQLKYYLLFAIVTTIFYYSSIDNEFSLDDTYIFQNIPMPGSSFSSIFGVFTQRFDVLDYRPIAMFTFALEQYIFGEINPSISHAINIFIYFMLCCLIFYIIQRLPIKNAQSIALVATLIFIVHPVHAGTINNLKSRDGLFSMLFLLLAINSYISYENSKKVKDLVLIAVFFLLGFNSKRDAYNLILILPILSYFIYNKNIKKSIIYFIACIVVVAIFGEFIIDRFVAPIGEFDTNILEVYTETPLAVHNTFLDKLSMSIATYFYYLKFMIIPKGYYFYFGFNQIPLRPIYHYITILQLIVVLLPLLAAYLLYKKSKTFAIGIILFYACLLYCSNLPVTVQGILADRYAFIASLGWCIALAALLYEILPIEKINQFIKSKLFKSSKATFLPLILTAILVVFYYPFVQSRNSAWQSIFTLIDADMPHLSNSYEANRIASTHIVKKAMSLNDQAERQTLFEDALRYAKQANAICDTIVYTQETEGIAYYGLGNVVEAEKQFKKVIAQFDTSIVSWDLLGDIEFSRKNFDSAALCYLNVYRIEKENESIYYKIPNALTQAGKIDSAFSFLNKLNQQYPDWYVPYESMAYLFYYTNNTYQGLQLMVTAFEKGLKNKDTYNVCKQDIVQGTKHADQAVAEKYKQLLLRLNNVSVY